MATEQWANKYRPRTFDDVVGQTTEVAILRRICNSQEDRPNVLMFTGPFGTGKTTLARLTARAILCRKKSYSVEQAAKPEAERGKPSEPCGTCEDCLAIDRENHPNFIETDSASQGSVADVRAMKDHVSYRAGDQPKILYYDESHMLSVPAQNALLQTLEEGSTNVLFIFCTTDQRRMLPTVRSRCVELQMRLLTRDQIAARTTKVAAAEGIAIDDKALMVLSTYVRGHARDALVLFQQLAKMANPVTEELVRTYLKLDRYEEAYKLLLIRDRKEGIIKLEDLLCAFAPAELAEAIGETFLNCYKLSLEIDTFTAFEGAWLRKILETRAQEQLLPLAEQMLTLNMDFAGLSYATTAMANVLFEKKQAKITTGPIGTAPQTPLSPGQVPAQFRKPGK